MKDRSEEAAVRLQSGFNCAQAVLSSYAGDLGLPDDAAPRIASLFGGGMGRTGEVCGAVTGALMVLGLVVGKPAPVDLEEKDRQHAMARELMARFRERHGSLLCRDLLGCVLSTPEGWAKAQNQGLFETLCPGLVRDAARFAFELAGGPRPDSGGRPSPR